jgi:glutaredoxin
MKVVEGKDKGKIVLYALSTCVWCKKVKKLLKKLGVKYSFIFVDELEGKEKEKIIKQLEKWNPRRSFPTVVINNEKCIVGYKEDEIKEALGL